MMDGRGDDMISSKDTCEHSESADKPFTAEHLHDALKKIQEAHGYFFNDDKEMTMGLLESLVVMHGRHGYMACPCRLVTGSYEHDRDIICPCAYRNDDVADYGACFCGLYVSKEWNTGSMDHCFVPDRRPVHLASAACDVHQEKHGKRHKDCK